MRFKFGEYGTRHDNLMPAYKHIVLIFIKFICSYTHKTINEHYDGQSDLLMICVYPMAIAVIIAPEVC